MVRKKKGLGKWGKEGEGWYYSVLAKLRDAQQM